MIPDLLIKFKKSEPLTWLGRRVELCLLRSVPGSDPLLQTATSLDWEGCPAEPLI